MTRLRDEFEPLLLSSYGYHINAANCAKAWDEECCDDARLEQQIARADVWLRQVGRRKTINSKIGSSYGLKHRVEGWHRQRQSGDCYVANGCFLMAAHRLGFKVQPLMGRYYGPGKGPSWDRLNAFLNISSRALSPPGV
jgi:hypothetical protein